MSARVLNSVLLSLVFAGVEIFTFGIHSGNVDELTTIASEPKPEHTYILKTFAEFEAVARRALYSGEFS